MTISKLNADKIVTMFNAAVDSYNKVAQLRNFPQHMTVVDDFNSALQYYSAIESAFREVIQNKLYLSCPNNLHEMIHILINQLSPKPLDNGIDLFYILRYKDTRNQATHYLKIQEQNPYPRLFLNGSRFIKTYIDSNAKLENWILDDTKFDFADFMQKFSTSKYDQIRVLVVGPMHDYDKSKLEVLSKIHWNVVLDFDPYSSESGFRSAISQINTYLIQLSKAERLEKSNLSIDYMTWVNCDGDHSLGVDSFSPYNSTNHITCIPSMVEGPYNWQSSFNISASRKNASQLLGEFFKAYYSVMGYNTDVVCLMDYSEPIMSSVVRGIEENLDSISYYTNIFFVDEISSNKLQIDKFNHNNWKVYKSTIYSFVEAIDKNISTSIQASQCEYKIPSEASFCDGVIPERIYHNINKHYHLLHKAFPTENDEPQYSEEKYFEELYNFSRGEEAKWHIIRKNEIAKFDIYSTALDQILECISKNSNVFDLFHVAGFGGTTISKQIAIHISRIFPVLYMKAYDCDSIGEQLKQIYSLSRKRVIIFIEEKLLNNTIRDREECIRNAEATSIPYTLIFIGRRPQGSQQRARNQVFIKHYIKEDIDKLLDFNKKVLAYSEPNNNRKLFEISSKEFIKNLGEQNCCPFIINLSIFADKFIRINEYVEEFVPSILSKPALLKVFVYNCIFSKFINEGLPFQFISDLLHTNSEEVLNELVEKFDPLLYVKNNDEFKIKEIAIRAPMIASALLHKLLRSNDNDFGYRSELRKFLLDLISDFKVYYAQRLYANKRLRQLFIDKISEESEYTDNFSEGRSEIESVKKYFAPVIVELWDKDNVDEAGSIFVKLTEEYTDDSYFFAHAARYYSYTYRNFDLAREYADKAINIFTSNGSISDNAAPDIYHVKGMCLMKQLFADLDELPTDASMTDKIDFSRIISIANDAIQAFSDTRKYAYGSNTKSVEYACSAWLKLLLQMLKIFDRYKMLEKPQVQEYLETAESLIEDLEDVFVLNAKEDLIEDLKRKKQGLISYRSDISKALLDWNNFFDRNKNDRIYENCLYACKHRYYLLENRLDNFKDINTDEDKQKINKLAEDYKYSLINTSVDKLKLGDLSTYISLVRFCNEKIAVVSSIINNLYLKDKDRPDVKILFYRYVLKFLSAYHGDRVALQETIAFLQECKERAERIAGKTNTLEFLGDGNEMSSLISKKYLLKVNPEVKNKIYESSQLGVLKGILKCDGVKTSIIPYDKEGRLMNGIEVFVNLKFNAQVRLEDNGQDVTFKMGFAYDGLRAENMSVRISSKGISENVVNVSQPTIAIGEIVDFTVTRCLRGKSENIVALIGKVGVNEDCMLHITNIAPRRKIDSSEMVALYEYCKTRELTVYLENKSEKGWSASLYKAGVSIENLIKN